MEKFSPTERHNRLTAARNALRGGNCEAMKKALAELPNNGTKAASLSLQLQSRLTSEKTKNIQGKFSRCVNANAQRNPSNSTQVKRKHEYDFYTVRIGGHLCRFDGEDSESSALFRVRSEGGLMVIILNMAHPSFGEFATLIKNVSGRIIEVHPIAQRFLIAWAQVELGSISKSQHDRMQQLREDIGRLLRDTALHNDDRAAG